MAQQPKTDILFPVGRFVQGSAYTPRKEDAEGKPLVIKNGPDAGKPRVDYYIAVAFQKQPGHTAWWQTDWGQKLMQAGAAAFPQAYQSPDFAWKVEDGDSTKINKRGRKPCDNEGWPGHWVVKFSGGYAPKICDSTGQTVITEPGALKCGYYVQVFGNVSGNSSISQPGIFVNHSAVAIAGYGPEIHQGLDVRNVGFGQGVQLPAGASAVPLAGATSMPGMAAPVPGMPQMPGAPAAMPGAPAAMPGAPAAMPAMPGAPAAGAPSLPQMPQMPAAPAAGVPAVPAVPVTPNTQFLAPQMPGAPAMPQAPAVPAQPQMTPQGLASGFTYAQYKASNWTDEALRANGLIY